MIHETSSNREQQSYIITMTEKGTNGTENAPLPWKKKKSFYSTPLLQAVREALLDRDLDCAIAAAGCLANYITGMARSIHPSPPPPPPVAATATTTTATQSSTTTTTSTRGGNTNHNTNRDDDASYEMETVTAGWVLLLVRRLRDCLVVFTEATITTKTAVAIATTTTTSTTSSGSFPLPAPIRSVKPSPKLQAWWELCERCMKCLVCLLETNPTAMKRLLPISGDTSLRNEVLDMCTHLLDQSSPAMDISPEPIGTPRTNTVEHSSTTTITVNGNSIAEWSQCRQLVQCWCCRCLHSIFDDNADLVIPWLQQQPETAHHLLKLVQSLITEVTNPNTTMDCATTTATANNMMTDGTGANGSNANPCSNRFDNSILSTARLHAVGAWLSLWMVLRDPSSSTMNIPSSNLTLPHESTLFATCVGLIHEQLASAAQRGIPDTHLQQQLQRAHDQFVQQSMDLDMEKQIEQKQQRTKEPARLIARRLAAQQQQQQQGNKKDGQVPMDQDDYNNDTRNPSVENLADENNWEMLLLKFQESCRPLQLSLEISANLTTTLSTSVVSQPNEGDEDDDHMMIEESNLLDPQIIEAVLNHDFPGTLVHLLSNLTSLSWSNGDVPAEVYDITSDLACKSLYCLCHCLTNLTGQGRWRVSENLWELLKNIWQKSVDTNVREALSSAMVLVAQQSGSASLQDMEFVIQNMVNRSTSTTPIVRDGVDILGTLMSRNAHPAALNGKVVQVLMNLSPCDNPSSTSPIVRAEVLNVLMDIYADDECHPDVFEALHVLAFMQRSVSLLKTSINTRQYETPDDVEHLKETVLNSTRFIRYKKDTRE